MNADTWAIARFTVLMAVVATALVLPPAIAAGWLLARRTFPGKTLVETMVSLPLYTRMTDSAVDRVISAVEEIVRGHRI